MKKSSIIKNIIWRFRNIHPQQNGDVERENGILINFARTIIDEYSKSKMFWVEVINTPCYTVNWIVPCRFLYKTPLWVAQCEEVMYLRLTSVWMQVLHLQNDNTYGSSKGDVILVSYMGIHWRPKHIEYSTMLEEKYDVEFDKTNDS
jgi:hypothetical protein